MPPVGEVMFQDLCRRLQEDSAVLGYFLTGSRGKGFATENSDYDLVIVVKDSEETTARARYPFRFHSKIDCIVHTLTDFRNYASFGTSQAWDRYSFAHVDVHFDTTGELQGLVDSKGTIPASARLAFLAEAMDSYINAVYRSIKRAERRDALGARLEAASSIPFFLDFAFGLEGRHAPFLGYLASELELYPLTDFPMPSDAMLAAVESILDSGDFVTQQSLVRLLEP